MSSMPWRAKEPVGFWAKRSVDVPSCPFPPRPAAPPCAAPLRPARGMSGVLGPIIFFIFNLRFSAWKHGPKIGCGEGRQSEDSVSFRMQITKNSRPYSLFEPESNNIPPIFLRLPSKAMEKLLFLIFLLYLLIHISRISLNVFMCPDMSCSHLIFLSSPTPGYVYHGRIGAGRRTAGRGGGAGTGRTRRRQVGSPKKQPMLLPSLPAKKSVLGVSLEARTNEFLCKPMEQKQWLTRGVSARALFVLGCRPVYRRLRNCFCT